jgi:diaminopimelate epimerase
MSAPFLKMVGAGNDFLVVDDRDGSHSTVSPTRWKALCSRRTGVGADGVLLLGASTEHDFTMRYLNADGREAEMCGNGARCLAWMAAVESGLGRDATLDTPRPPGWELDEGTGARQVWSLSFEATDGLHHALGWERRVAVSMGTPTEAADLTVETTSGSVTGMLVRVGVPHFVVRVADPGDVAVETLGPELREHESMGTDGANVDWLAMNPDENGAWSLRTFERGVEAETLSCGTGTAASAALLARGGAPSPVDIRTRSGETLGVYFEMTPQGPCDLWLEGPISLVYRGNLADI